jgi:flavin reductase (DIM6/NTAB) family NADH-FMN oxidoreductase RutF
MVHIVYKASDFKNAMANLTHGVSVLSVLDQGLIYGMTINSFTSVSLDPTLVLFSISKQTKNIDKYLNCQSFTVSVLSDKQRNIADYFSRANRDQNTMSPWFMTDGSQAVKGSLSHFMCEIQNKIDAGGSYIIVGAVKNVGILNSNGKPLLYLQRSYFSLGDKINA